MRSGGQVKEPIRLSESNASDEQKAKDLSTAVRDELAKIEKEKAGDADRQKAVTARVTELGERLANLRFRIHGLEKEEREVCDAIAKLVSVG